MDIESLDDLALRISEEVREMVNRRVVEYFGRLIVASGQRRVRVVQPQGRPCAPKEHKGPPAKERQLLDMLKDGPRTSKEIAEGLDLASRQMVVYTVGRAKRLLEGTKKVIRCKRGRGEKPSTYALRDVDWKEGDGAD